MNITARYDAVSRFLHWLVVTLVGAQFVLGWTMPDVHRDTKPVGLIAWHLGIGMVILLFVLIRFLWRSTHVVPPDVVTLPPALRAFLDVVREVGKGR